MNTYKEAQDIIDGLRLKYASLPKQGSSEWLELRKTRFGGSEIEKVINNQFSSLIKDKIYGSSFKGNTATQHGKLFEQIGARIIELMYDTKIYEFGSIPNEEYTGFSYSPDGLCIVKRKDKFYIVLIEIKSPFSTKPDQKIPKKYIPQVMSGLAHFKDVSFGIFANVVYRVCTKEQLSTDDYNTNHHSQDNGCYDDVEPNGLGFFKLYKTEKCLDEYAYYQYLLNKPKPKHMEFTDSEVDEIPIKNSFAFAEGDSELIGLDNFMDFGDSDIKRLLYMIDQGIIQVTIGDVYLNKNFTNTKADHFRSLKNCSALVYNSTIDAEECEIKNGNDNYMGTLCFKIFECDLIKVKKDPDYINNFSDRLKTATDLLRKIAISDDPQKSYTEIFK